MPIAGEPRLLDPAIGRAPQPCATLSARSEYGLQRRDDGSAPLPAVCQPLCELERRAEERELLDRRDFTLLEHPERFGRRRSPRDPPAPLQRRQCPCSVLLAHGERHGWDGAPLALPHTCVLLSTGFRYRGCAGSGRSSCLSVVRLCPCTSAGAVQSSLSVSGLGFPILDVPSDEPGPISPSASGPVSMVGTYIRRSCDVSSRP